MNIVVLSGGYSPERDVSLASGCMICNALSAKGHCVVLVDAYLGIDEPKHNLNSLFIAPLEYQTKAYAVPSVPPDLAMLKQQRKPYSEALLGVNVINICRQADITFIALHGESGENGQIQATLDMHGIKYTGSGFMGSALAMNKNLTKLLLRERNVPTPPWFHITHPQNIQTEDINLVGFPCVIKPTSGGSSVGVTIAKSWDEFQKGIELAAQISTDILIEKYISGREFCVGILDGRPLRAIEIIPVNEFFDYECKYQTAMAQEICPTDLKPELEQELQKCALKVHRILELGFYSRVDFILEPGGNFYCLEVNPLPGMTAASIFPREAAVEGISFESLCDLIANTENKAIGATE